MGITLTSHGPQEISVTVISSQLFREARLLQGRSDSRQEQRRNGGPQQETCAHLFCVVHAISESLCWHATKASADFALTQHRLVELQACQSRISAQIPHLNAESAVACNTYGVALHVALKVLRKSA